MPVKKSSVGSRKSVSALSVPVYSLAGKESGTLVLPKEVFGDKVNKKLLAQALRVYSTNQKHLTGFTKTRGEVVGSTAKIYSQKGTGRARHGAVRAPIFVGGGIAFGPKPRKVRLILPQRMKKAALFASFASKLKDKKILGLSGLEKASGKTKELANWLDKVKVDSALILTGEKQSVAVRAARNIPNISILPFNMINAFEVLKHKFLVVTEAALEKLTK